MKKILRTISTICIFMMLISTIGCATNGFKTKINGVNPTNPAANKQEVNKGFWNWCGENEAWCAPVLIVGGFVIGSGVKKLFFDDDDDAPTTITTTKPAPAPAPAPAPTPPVKNGGSAG